MSVIRRCAFGAICAAVLLQASARAAGDDALPRYRLRVGQELTYTLKSESAFGEGAKAVPYGSDDEWRVRVLRQNPDGSWRLLLHESQSFWQGRDKKVQRGEQALDYCDLFPDGQHVAPALFGYSARGLDPTRVFPRLPADVAAAAAGWEGTYAADDARTRYTLDQPAPAPGTIRTFLGVRETPLDKIHLLSSRASYTYDPDRGLVVKAAETNSLARERKKITVTIELRGVRECDAAETARLDAEAERYFAAAKLYDDLTAQAESSTNPKELFTKAEAALKDVRGKLTLPVFLERVDYMLKWHDFLAKNAAESFADTMSMLGKPSPDWETKDFQGNTHTLKEFRGKVVVLDFWGRGCGWCMRALPQVARLADDFKGEPVVVLGMSVDRLEEDARLVIEKMQIGYPVLKARELLERYHLHGMPVLIVLDAKGVVRRIHNGYQPTLHDDVAKLIRKLLAENDSATRR
jgi:thiol-disulfide isomerase/thioredoxin